MWQRQRPLPARPRGARTRACTRAARALTLCLLSLIYTARVEAIWPFERGSGRGDALGERAAHILSEAIRFDTTNPPGGEAALAAYLVDLLRNAGIEAAQIPTPSQPGTPPRAAAWGRLPGTGAARPIVLLSHLDVVPAAPADWEVDPFAGATENGFVIGRGALDAKGVTVIHLLTLIELARLDTPLDRDVIFLATPDEELGGRDGAGYLVREHPDLIAGAEYLLTEGGSILPLARAADGALEADTSSREVWSVAVTEKSPCWLEITTRGTPGHSAAPARDAAVPRLIAALDRIRRTETPIRVLPEVARMFRVMAPLAPQESRAGYHDLTEALRIDSSFRQRFLSERSQNALVRDTVSITVLRGGPRTNVAPSEASAQLDARLLPGESCDNFMRSLEGVIADPGVRLKPLLAFSSSGSPIDTKLFRAIERVARETSAGALVVPRMIAGFTDAHWFRELGIVAYGFVPRWLSREEARGVHGPGERTSFENLQRAVQTLTRIIEELGE